MICSVTDRCRSSIHNLSPLLPLSVFHPCPSVALFSISLREDDAAGGGLAGDHALARLLRALEGDAADRRLRLGRDAVFRRARAVPVGQQEAARVFELLLELVVGIDLEEVRIAEVLRLLEERRLHLTQELV